MGISSLIYDSWMKEAQFKKFSGIIPMLKTVDLTGKTLDVGIGTGLFEDYLKGEGIPLDVQGIEIDSNMLSEARKKGYAVAQGTAEQLQFEDNSFDFVVCIDTIHAVSDKKRAVNEMVRVLKPNKHFLLVHFCNTFTKHSVSEELDNLTEGLEVVSKKLVGHSDEEIAIAFLVKKK